MRFRLSRGIFLLCVLLGLWQLGQVGWFHGKAWLAGHLIERAWQQSLVGARQVRPWPWADTWPAARLSVPRLGIDQIVLSGDSGRVLAFAPGYTQQKVLPGSGVNIISAHRDTHFAFLKALKKGDEIKLTTPGKVTQYQVKEFAVVDAREYVIDPAYFADQQHTDQSSLLLVTCFPFDALLAGGYKRFLVLAVSSPGEII